MIRILIGVALACAAPFAIIVWEFVKSRRKDPRR